MSGVIRRDQRQTPTRGVSAPQSGVQGPEASNATEQEAAAAQIEVDAARGALYAAVDGWGTDEEAIYTTLRGLSVPARNLIGQDAEIMGWLEGDMNSSELEQVNSILGTGLSQVAQEFNRDLGETEDYGGISTAVGGLLESLAPEPGSVFKGAISITLRVPMGFSVRFGMELEGERSDHGFQLELKSNLFLGYIAPSVVCDFEVGATFRLEAQGRGDSGVECMNLMGLAMRAGIADWLNEEWAGAMFGAEWTQGVVENMDRAAGAAPVDPGPNASPEAIAQYQEDLAAYRLAVAEQDSAQLVVGASGDMSASADPGEGNGPSAGVTLGLGAQRELGLQVDEHGELQTEARNDLTLRFGFNIGDYGVLFEGLFGLNGEGARLKVKLTGSVPLDGASANFVVGYIQRLGQQVVNRVRELATGVEDADQRTAVQQLANHMGSADYGVISGFTSAMFEDYSSQASEGLDWQAGSSLDIELKGTLGLQGGAVTGGGVELMISNKAGMRGAVAEELEIYAGLAQVSASYETATKLVLL